MTGLGNAPDLVIFDVDGTVHDAFAWWAPLIRRGLVEFTARTGIVLSEPSDEEACAVVGMKDAGVWGPFLPEEHRHRWAELRSVILPLEIEELGSGVDYLFPGVRDLLAHLREIGVGTSLASNCRGQYMDGICRGQGLSAATDWQFCLDSEGVETKTDMLRAAVRISGASRPVMVGDREPDHLAAEEVGMPFVWRVNSRCSISGADGWWHGDPDELLDLLGLPRITARRDEA